MRSKYYMTVIIAGLICGMFWSIYPTVALAAFVFGISYVFVFSADDDDVCTEDCDKNSPS